MKRAGRRDATRAPELGSDPIIFLFVRKRENM
jgi:hypothetical protein